MVILSGKEMRKMKKITDMDIMRIDNKEQVGRYLVKRLNMEDFDVYHDGKIVFNGNDEEVADFINFHNFH